MLNKSFRIWSYHLWRHMEVILKDLQHVMNFYTLHTFFSWQVLLNCSLGICYGKQHDSSFDKWHILIFMFEKGALFQWMLPGPEPVSHPLWYIAFETSPRFIFESLSWALYHPADWAWNRSPHNNFKTRWLSKAQVPVCDVIRMQRLSRPTIIVQDLSVGADCISFQSNKQNYRAIYPIERNALSGLWTGTDLDHPGMDRGSGCYFL